MLCTARGQIHHYVRRQSVLPPEKQQPELAFDNNIIAPLQALTHEAFYLGFNQAGEILANVVELLKSPSLQRNVNTKILVRAD